MLVYVPYFALSKLFCKSTISKSFPMEHIHSLKKTTSHCCAALKSWWVPLETTNTQYAKHS